MLKKASKTVLSLILIGVIILISCLFTSCSENLEQKLTTHEWVTTRGDMYVFCFYENGTYKMTRSYTSGMQISSKNGTWSIDGSKLYLSDYHHDEPFVYKNVSESDDLSTVNFDSDDWYVNNQFLYLNGDTYIAQN